MKFFGRVKELDQLRKELSADDMRMTNCFPKDIGKIISEANGETNNINATKMALDCSNGRGKL